MRLRGRYDDSLQLFVDEAHEPELARLAFLRRLGEHGLLEHDVHGAPSGELAGQRDAAEVTVSMPHGTTQ